MDLGDSTPFGAHGLPWAPSCSHSLRPNTHLRRKRSFPAASYDICPLVDPHFRIMNFGMSEKAGSRFGSTQADYSSNVEN